MFIDLIINYLKEIFKIMLIFLPIIIGLRLIYFKISKKEFNIKYEIRIIIFILFLIALAFQTDIIYQKNYLRINLTQINIIPFRVIVETYNEILKHNYNYFFINFLGNIIIFIPIGFMFSSFWKLNLKKVLLLGFSISLFIELNQLFINRGTDIDDLLLNLLGTFLGYLIYRIFFKTNIKS